MESSYIAIDIGASSGRVVVFFNNGLNYEYKVIHRFKDYLRSDKKYLYWDIDYMYDQILKGIKFATKNYSNIKSIGIDTFGVDVVLLDNKKQVLIEPFSYRNNLGLVTSKIVEKSLPRERLYNLTGIQYNHFNTLYQLVYFKEVLDLNFNKVLLLPDYFAYLLTGEMRTEETIFSSTNLMNARNYQMIDEIEKLKLNKDMFPPLIKPGETYGYLKPEVKDLIKINYDIKVVSVCSHDTASAVRSIPNLDSRLFLNSGTMGVLGALIDSPVLTSKSLYYNYSNELGHDRKVRLLKNTMGLWIQNEAIRAYINEYPNKTLEEVRKTVLESRGVKSFIDVDDDRFTAPSNMITAINSYLRETNQEELEYIGDIIFCIYQSLALKYYFNIEELEEITNNNYDSIHVIGGGSNIDVFLQIIADITRKKVYRGETEATILGNLYVQLNADQKVDNIDNFYNMITKRENKIYYPNNDKSYENVINKFNKIFN